MKGNAMNEILQDLLAWAPSVILLIILLGLLILFGFWMGRMTQDKPIIEHKLFRPRKMPTDLPDGDIFRDAMQGEDKEKRIPTTRP